MPPIREFAPAKINLTLEVLGKRADGYHEIASLVAFARDAADEIVFDASQPPQCTVSGPFGGTIAGQNLLEVTLRKLAEADSALNLGAVSLIKNLPVAAGIGGGSADAAALLRAVQQANPGRASAIDWLGIARSLGADVPVCVHNEPAWMTGIGEIIDVMLGLPVLHAVLVNPLQPMPADKTAQVFRALAAQPLPPGQNPQLKPAFASRDELIDFIRTRGNTLTSAAQFVAPVIKQVLGALGRVEGCQYEALSGAGPTCFGIFESPEAARAAAKDLSRQHTNWWVRASVLR